MNSVRIRESLLIFQTQLTFLENHASNTFIRALKYISVVKLSTET